MIDDISLCDENGEIIVDGESIDDDTIPVCYQGRIQLLRACGFNNNLSKVIGIFIHEFKPIDKYVGGEWVAA